MPNVKKDTNSYFYQVLYLTVAYNDKTLSKPYTVKQVVEMFKSNKIKIFNNVAQLNQSTDSGIQSLLNGMLDLNGTAKYSLYLYEKKGNNFCKVATPSLSLNDLYSDSLYLSEQADL